jgi:hypothetical protein
VRRWNLKFFGKSKRKKLNFLQRTQMRNERVFKEKK